MSSQDSSRIPIRLRPRVQEIDALTGAICAAHLNDEYAELARRMAAALARLRPSPLERGDARVWAAAIVHAAGWVNFLTDPAQKPHMTATQLAEAAGVGQSTIAANARKIRDALGLGRMDPEWTLPSMLADNPLAWMIEVNGMLMDARHLPPEIQREALRQGAIPFLPLTMEGPQGDAGIGNEDEAGPGSLPPELRAAVEMLFQQAVEMGPGTTLDELNAALAATAGGYNERPQPELSGLSPDQVERLIRADWVGAASAIQLDPSLPLGELEASRTLDDARLVLALLAEQPTGVKATPKGNLPRAFVAAFRERMRTRGTAMEEREHGRDAGRALNEEDVWSLHIVRLLLELAGLVKRRKGVISRTRRGEQLTDAARAGELFMSLVQAQFRRMDLSYLDRAEEAPELQYTIGFSLYQLARADDAWRSPGEWLELLVLPAVRDELPVNRLIDLSALILETRFLRPLEGFGLVESRELPRAAGEYLTRRQWRRTALLGRVVSFGI